VATIGDALNLSVLLFPRRRFLLFSASRGTTASNTRFPSHAAVSPFFQQRAAGLNFSEKRRMLPFPPFSAVCDAPILSN
jgi:hypothetical protein